MISGHSFAKTKLKEICWVPVTFSKGKVHPLQHFVYDGLGRRELVHLGGIWDETRKVTLPVTS